MKEINYQTQKVESDSDEVMKKIKEESESESEKKEDGPKGIIGPGTGLGMGYLLKNKKNKYYTIGNSERKISEEEGKKCCKENDFYCFCETSAKTGFNSQEIFIKALKLLYINHQKYKSGEVGEQAAKEISNKKLGKELLEREKKKKKKCC